MTKKDEALKLAMEAMEDVEKNCTYWEAEISEEEFTKRIAICKEALGETK